MKIPHPETEWMSIAEASVYVGCSRQTLHKYISLGYVPAYSSPTGMRRLRRSEIDALFKEDLG